LRRISVATFGLMERVKAYKDWKLSYSREKEVAGYLYKKTFVIEPLFLQILLKYRLYGGQKYLCSKNICPDTIKYKKWYLRVRFCCIDTLGGRRS